MTLFTIMGLSKYLFWKISQSPHT